MKTRAVSRIQASLRGFGWVATTLPLLACHEHVVLVVPSSNAPFAVRAAAYEKLRPVRSFRSTISGGDYNFEAYLELADRRRVYLVDDLIQAVPGDSETVRSISRFQSRQTKADWLGGAALLFMIAGGSLFVVGASRGDPPDFKMAGTGLAVGAGGGLAFGIASQSVRNGATAARFKAYESYDGDLQRRLSICVPPVCGGKEVIRDAERPSKKP